MKVGRIHSSFQEGPLLFAPTYKRKPGKLQEISTKKNPSWTDRILYSKAPDCQLEQKSYDSNNLVTLSDHRPVFSQFLLGIKRPGGL
jgi:hypothetical protein